MACGTKVLTSFVQTKDMPFVLDGLPHTQMSRVIVVAEFAERISAAFRATVGTDRRPAVTALGHGSLAAWRPNVAVTGYILDLAIGAHAALSCANSANNIRMRLR